MNVSLKCVMSCVSKRGHRELNFEAVNNVTWSKDSLLILLKQVIVFEISFNKCNILHLQHDTYLNLGLVAVESKKKKSWLLRTEYSFSLYSLSLLFCEIRCVLFHFSSEKWMYYRSLCSHDIFTASAYDFSVASYATICKSFFKTSVCCRRFAGRRKTNAHF